MMMAATLFLSILSFPLLLSLPLPLDAAISTTALDSFLQDYAFKAFSSPKTGVPYDAEVPKNLTGVKVSAMRLKSHSLRTRGVQNYKEFHIPTGVIEHPYAERLVLVYHNLGNWSDTFYPLPSGYSYLTPVLGLLSYSAFNLSATELPKLDIRASSDKPILIEFPNVKHAPFGASIKCVYFDLNGSVHLDTVLTDNVCSTLQQGHFSIVGKKKMNKLWIIVALSLVGGCILLILLSLWIVKAVRRRRKMQKFYWETNSNENLDMISIYGTREPVAGAIRTSPTIDIETVD